MKSIEVTYDGAGRVKCTSCKCIMETPMPDPYIEFTYRKVDPLLDPPWDPLMHNPIVANSVAWLIGRRRFRIVCDRYHFDLIGTEPSSNTDSTALLWKPLNLDHLRYRLQPLAHPAPSLPLQMVYHNQKLLFTFNNHSICKHNPPSHTNTHVTIIDGQYHQVVVPFFGIVGSAEMMGFYSSDFVNWSVVQCTTMTFFGFVCLTNFFWKWLH